MKGQGFKMELIITHKGKGKKQEIEIERVEEIERAIKIFCETFNVRTCNVEFKGRAKLQDKNKYELSCLFG